MGREKWRESLIWGMGICLSLFLLYTSGFGEFRLTLQRGLPLLLASILIFLQFPVRRERPEPLSKRSRLLSGLERFINAIFLLASLFAIGYAGIFASTEDMDENLIYSLTKAFWENIDEFHKSHVLAKTVIQKTFMRGMTIPLHKGAERYYKEVGWIR